MSAINIVVAVAQHADRRIFGYIRRDEPTRSGKLGRKALVFKQFQSQVIAFSDVHKLPALDQYGQYCDSGFDSILEGNYLVDDSATLERDLALKIIRVIEANDDFGSSNLQKRRAIHDLLRHDPDLLMFAAMSASRAIQPAESWSW
ncbi:hypothetical protein NRY68_06020 [Acidithiobacillus ferrooxidans]|uniref:hypothetical protein n=1 Tax=Acidithiobacillus ferrooxidans TaxID=920 RepID=UPI0021498307|nr:hypothetical protein [Acidithiobacillus ferrooxidans]MCR1345364.1 hypothetical protein [Acidithiobacillus ferrooxidans]MCR1354524.1 hypothetical protein [Acidithiobacillus ferrooxidans]